MAVRLDNARDTIPGHILTLTCVPSLDDYSPTRSPPPARRYSHCTRRCYLPVLGGSKGKQVFCASPPCSCSTVRVAHCKPRELLSLSQTRSRHSQLGLELSRKPTTCPSNSADRSKGRWRQDPLEDHHLHLGIIILLSHIEHSQRRGYCTLSHAGYLNPWFVLASGLVSPPLPFIASPFMLPSVTPTGTNPRPSL